MSATVASDERNSVNGNMLFKHIQLLASRVNVSCVIVIKSRISVIETVKDSWHLALST